MSAGMIGNAINPNFHYDKSSGHFLAITLMVCMVMDVVEFFNKLSKKK